MQIGGKCVENLLITMMCELLRGKKKNINSKKKKKTFPHHFTCEWAKIA
jgi:hypothetical protein